MKDKQRVKLTCRENWRDINFAESNEVDRGLRAGVIRKPGFVSLTRGPAALEAGLRKVHELLVGFQKVHSDLQLVIRDGVDLPGMLPCSSDHEGAGGNMAVVSWRGDGDISSSGCATSSAGGLLHGAVVSCGALRAGSVLVQKLNAKMLAREQTNFSFTCSWSAVSSWNRANTT